MHQSNVQKETSGVELLWGIFGATHRLAILVLRAGESWIHSLVGVHCKTFEAPDDNWMGDLTDRTNSTQPGNVHVIALLCIQH